MPQTFFQHVLVYLTGLVVFLVVDLTWLGLVAKHFYQDKLGYLLGSVVWPVAFLFYALFVVGVLIFAVYPALDARSFTKAILFGALFGFFTYATYDLTNHATIKDWPALVSVVDIAWGTVLSLTVSAVTYWIAIRFFVS